MLAQSDNDISFRMNIFIYDIIYILESSSAQGRSMSSSGQCSNATR